MAHTKSPSAPPGTGISTAPSTRPYSEFDVGVNTSAAWTEHLEREALSDDDPEHGRTDPAGTQYTSRPARAVYSFAGEAAFQELAFAAGDALEVLREDLADGWSLARYKGAVGLVPRAYYIFTADFAAAPRDSSAHTPRASESSGTRTPTGPPPAPAPPDADAPAAALLPQNTGDWFRALPSFRQSLLGGKSLNRFSSFVTSGAEEWVLSGSPAEDAPAHAARGSSSGSSDEGLPDGRRLSVLGHGADTGEADVHFVEAGPAWRPKVPPFRVLVHSPARRTSSLTGAYTVYSVTSLFPSDAAADAGPARATRITVQRRFSHFACLHAALAARLPGVALPPLPEKQHGGRLRAAFVEARRRELQRYLARVVRHPLARYAEAATAFLSCESDVEWRRQLPQLLALPPAGAAFYARVFHPAFNVDAEDAADAVARFDNHTRAVGLGVQQLRGVFGRIRAARAEMSGAERLLSYSLLALITSTPLASTAVLAIGEDDEDEDEASAKKKDKRKGLLNEDGAWCWREDCTDCLKLTKAMQRTSETLQGVADLYDNHARHTLLETHEALKDVAHPSTIYAPVIDTHRSALSRYKEALDVSAGTDDDAVAARCETVLNTTMAEFETYHTQKREDFARIAAAHLDGEIAFYEQVLTRLRTARAAFDAPAADAGAAPRAPSVYERELAEPRLAVPPLPQPCPHVFDSAPLRPVSAAIQGGVGMLLGGGVGASSGRGSVFGKFW